jgi:hypothetical protein
VPATVTVERGNELHRGAVNGDVPVRAPYARLGRGRTRRNASPNRRRLALRFGSSEKTPAQMTALDPEAVNGHRRDELANDIDRGPPGSLA